MGKLIGVLTAGGDTPGLNAALRAIGKTAIGYYDMQVIGFLDGFRGLVENRSVRLVSEKLSGILTTGGTILGTSRDKPHRMQVGGKKLDMTDVILENYEKHHLDTLICMGGGGTQKNALRLAEKGMNIITLPKTIDNDVAMTDITFGFDTAMGIATDAIDRLHSTAHSHHRIIVVEIMGHRVGWLALGAGLAGGADVILIPEIPYNINDIADSIMARSRIGKRFSIVAVAEGAVSKESHESVNSKDNSPQPKDKEEGQEKFSGVKPVSTIVELATQLEDLTGLETRVTILGHLQRGGTPSANDRLLATRLGTACADLIHKGKSGIMVAAKGDSCSTVPLEKVAGQKKFVPLDHPWIESAKRLGVNLGIK
jgi:6-phosphofructokinase 1